ncbi:MAG: 3-isopropylmalate dehydrogenase [bacterium JZ-2024 1]
MKTYTIAVIPGDGIGVEVIREGKKVLNALKKRLDLPIETVEYPEISGEGYLKRGTALPPEVFSELKQMDAIYFGAVGDPRISDPEYAKQIVLTLRFGLDLYVNLRPTVLLDPSLTPLEKKNPIDFVVIRENTEDLYVGAGGVMKSGTTEEVALQTAIYTYAGTYRIIHFAFEFARKTGRKRVTMVDKSNVLTYGHDLWQRVFWMEASRYPDITSDHLYVDNAAQQLVKRPWEFEVIVTTNMFGDILSDLAGEIVGGLGVAPSGNINPETRKGMFEPVHGSAPKYAGKNVANPIGAVLSLALLLEFLGFPDAAKLVEGSVRASVRAGVRTRDLGGSSSTSEVGDFFHDFILSTSPSAL